VAASASGSIITTVPAGEIAARSPMAVRLTWEALHRGMNLTLEESAQLGADYFGLVAASNDFRVGTAAFIERKRGREAWHSPAPGRAA
jgi:enoyl-CoA hydratase/carnithine racemase